jgi:hypothetical protein
MDQPMIAKEKMELDEKKDSLPTVATTTGRIANDQVQQVHQQAPQQAQTPSPSQDAVPVQAAAPVPSAMAFRDQQTSFRAGASNSVGALMSKAAPAGIRYSLTKRDASGAFVPVSRDGLTVGDAIRVTVVSPGPGVLSLLRFDVPTGGWKPVGESVVVRENVSYVIPGTPIDVQANDQMLRISLLPSSAGQSQAAPVTVDIPIAPRPAQ